MLEVADMDQPVNPTIKQCAALSCAAHALCTRLQAALNARTGEHKQCCMGTLCSLVLSLYATWCLAGECSHGRRHPTCLCPALYFAIGGGLHNGGYVSLCWTFLLTVQAME